jgi:hypothetical protein
MTIADFWQKFKEEWNKKLIAGAVATTLLVLGFFGRSALDWLKRFNTEIQNVSQSRAVEIAKQYLGQTVSSALPFRNVGDSHQYIAATVGTDTHDLEGMRAFLLTSRDDKYEVRILQTTVMYPQEQGERGPVAFGLADVDGNGQNEVFTVFRDGGTGLYSIEVGLYDVSGSAYLARQSHAYSDISFEPELSPNTSEKPKIREWLSAKGQEFMIARIEPSSVSHEQTLWQQSQGAEFKGGIVRINEFPGKIPKGGSINCEVEDAEFIWISFFKGGVFAYNKKRNVHFVVWVPDSPYDATGELTSGEQYLWLGEPGNGAQIFDKQEHTLHAVGSMAQIKATELANPSRCKPQENDNPQ